MQKSEAAGQAALWTGQVVECSKCGHLISGPYIEWDERRRDLWGAIVWERVPIAAFCPCCDNVEVI